MRNAHEFRPARKASSVAYAAIPVNFAWNVLRPFALRKRDRGGPVSVHQSDRYRFFAEQCMDMAGSVSDEQVRAALIQMAQVWFRLAEERQDRVVENPTS